MVTKVLSKCMGPVARADGRRIECGAKLCVFRSRNGVFLMDCDAKLGAKMVTFEKWGYGPDSSATGGAMEWA